MATADAAAKSKGGEEPQVGSSRAELKQLLRHAKKDAVHVALAVDGSNKVVILGDKRREGRTLLRELKGSASDTKNHRFGELTIDPENPKRACFSLDKQASGLARRVVVALKGTGFSKVQISTKDGAAPETHEEPDEDEADDEDEKAEAKADGKSAKPVDAGKMVAELTPLVREALELGAKNPPLKPKLQKLCTAAQTSLRKVMLSLDPKEAEQVQDDIDALHNAVEDAREGGGGAAAAKPAGQPSAQQVAETLTGLVRNVPAAVKASPDQAAHIKGRIAEAHAALKSGNVQKAHALVNELGTIPGLGAVVGKAAASGSLAESGTDLVAGALAGGQAAAATGKAVHNPQYHKAAQSWEKAYGEARKEADRLRDHFRKAFAGHGAGPQIISAFEKELEIAIGLGVPAIPLARRLYDLGKTHKDQLGKALGETRVQVKKHIEHVTSSPFLAEIERNPVHPTKIRHHMATGLKDVFEVLGTDAAAAMK